MPISSKSNKTGNKEKLSKLISQLLPERNIVNNMIKLQKKTLRTIIREEYIRFLNKKMDLAEAQHQKKK